MKIPIIQGGISPVSGLRGFLGDDGKVEQQLQMPIWSTTIERVLFLLSRMLRPGIYPWC